MTDHHLSYPKWLAYGVGHVLNDVCASMWFTYLLIFFKKVLQFSDTISGSALLIGQVADGISTPIVGILADKRFQHRIFKYGRRKVWHLVGTICVMSSFPFIFSPFFGFKTDDRRVEFLYYCLFIVVFQFGWASTQISHLSLVNDLTPHEDERTSLFTVRYSFTVLSNLAVYALLYVIFKSTRMGNDSLIGPHDLYNFQLVAYIAVGLGTLMSIIFHIFIEDKSYTTLATHSEQTSRTSILTSKRTYEAICVYMSTRLFVNLGQTYIPLYLQDTLHLPSQYLAVLPFIMFITGYITSFIIKPLNVQFGRKVTYMLSAFFGLITCLWIRVGHDDYYKYYEIYAVVGCYGAFGSLMLVTSLGIVSDLIGRNTETGAFVFGIMSFADKIANGLVVFVIEYIRSFQPDNHCYYKHILFYVCGTVAILAIISVMQIKPSDYIVLQEPAVNNGNEILAPQHAGDDDDEEDKRNNSSLTNQINNDSFEA